MTNFLLKTVEPLLKAALEGGSNHWYVTTESNIDYLRKMFPITFNSEVPFYPEGYLAIQDKYGFLEYPEILNIHKLLNGLIQLKRTFPSHYYRFQRHDYDSRTADIYLQLCLFNEIIFD